MGLEDEINRILSQGWPPRTLRVYCAGPIEPNDWRENLFPGALTARPGAPAGSAAPGRDGFVYAGPYLTACGPVCDHEPPAVCAEAERELRVIDPIRREEVLHRRMDWILGADVVFAWIDAHTVYLTVAEIAWAYATLRPIFVGICGDDFPVHGSEGSWGWTLAGALPDLLFIREMCDGFVATPTVEDAWLVFGSWIRRSLPPPKA